MPADLHDRMHHVDPLGAALGELRSDVERVRLLPADAVRARGRRRGRIQRAGTMAGVTAAVVLVIVAGAPVLRGGVNRGEDELPAGPATSASLSTSRGVPVEPGGSSTGTPTSRVSNPAPPLYPKGRVSGRWFLAPSAWSGHDLVGGHPLRWQAPPQAMSKGTIQGQGTAPVQGQGQGQGQVTGPGTGLAAGLVGTCDADGTWSGLVGIVELVDSVTGATVGVQRVRGYDSPLAAKHAFRDLVTGMERCQAVSVAADSVSSLDVSVSADVGNPSVVTSQTSAVYRVEVVPRDGGSEWTEWVAFVRANGGDVVSTLVVIEPPATTSDFISIRRVAAAAGKQLVVAWQH